MRVFPRHFVAPHHSQPTTPIKSLVVLVKKLSKMEGNSASKPLNSTPNELPCINVEWWRIAWKKLYAFSRYTAFNISNRYSKYLYVIARIRPVLANPVTYRLRFSYTYIIVFGAYESSLLHYNTQTADTPKFASQYKTSATQ